MIEKEATNGGSGESKGGQEAPLEQRIASLGRTIGNDLRAVLEQVPGSPHGTQSLAQTLTLDKVLTSRLLKALRANDPIAVAHYLPGPEPLRRMLKAARRKGVDSQLIARANAVVAEFEDLVRQEAGDRSSLDAIIASWLPEVRRDFELRRKQAAFKATSQLKGVMADTLLSTVLLHPGSDGESIDVVWIFGLLGLRRLRPGVSVKFATRRITLEGDPRRPMNLSGAPIEVVDDARLDEFCAAPPAEVIVHTVGDVLHYTLGGAAFGPRAANDLVLVEANYNEMPRYLPEDSQRKGYVFSEISTPAKAQLFDVLVHEDIYPGSQPQLLIYETALDGVADVNDPVRDVDRMDMVESIQLLGRSVAQWRHTRVPSYTEMLRHIFAQLGWSDTKFRGYRCAVDYPVYGSQITMAFDPPTRPSKL